MPDDVASALPSIERCDVLIVNEVEAASLMRIRSSLATLGPELVIITRGGDGLTYLMKGVEYRVPAAVLPGDLPVIDTVGAGDAFVGVFTTRWAELRSGGAMDDSGLRDAMYWGAAAGALACTKRGAIPSLPDRSDVVRLLQSQ
jgi:sugar/nucleoside kinase (ribokinase family)